MTPRTHPPASQPMPPSVCPSGPSPAPPDVTVNTRGCKELITAPDRGCHQVLTGLPSTSDLTLISVLPWTKLGPSPGQRSPSRLPPCTFLVGQRPGGSLGSGTPAASLFALAGPSFGMQRWRPAPAARPGSWEGSAEAEWGLALTPCPWCLSLASPRPRVRRAVESEAGPVGKRMCQPPLHISRGMAPPILHPSAGLTILPATDSAY